MQVFILFHGLCMFVEDAGTVYALLPAAHGDMSGVPAHAASLVYDARMDDPPRAINRVQPIGGFELLFDGFDTAATGINWTGGLVNYSDFAQVRVRRDHLTQKTAELGARVVLHNGMVAGTGAVACWEIEYVKNGATIRQTVALTDVVTFTATVPDDKLRWALRPLDDPNPPAPEDWVVITGPAGGEIVLQVDHVTAEIRNVTPTVGEEAHHYAAYLQLLELGNKAKLPTFKNVNACGSSLRAQQVVLPSPTVLTCMVGGGG